WAKSFGGAGSDRGYVTTVDASGNIYTSGIYRDTVDFDPGAGTTNLSANGFDDVFVQKMDPQGNFLWAKSFGGSSVEIGRSITVDASGNVYAIGEFIGTVDFDPGAGTTNLSSNGGADFFVQKMSQLTTGIVENSYEHKLVVYPNPSSGIFSIDLGAVHESSIFTITDISGKLIETITITQSQVLNLSIKEPAGIYFVSIQTGNKKATIKLIKE
ncbi:MAG: T9SS type A sorting domain-containing protein, partial [Candidatus Margulisbacteria bacterium]|nr:T9SS type A sorting domain-containing protein [Candidatus Margulisiibacteriota bacterium]